VSSSPSDRQLSAAYSGTTCSGAQAGAALLRVQADARAIFLLFLKNKPIFSLPPKGETPRGRGRDALQLTGRAEFATSRHGSESEVEERAGHRRIRGVPNPHGLPGERAEGHVLGRLPRLLVPPGMALKQGEGVSRHKDRTYGRGEEVRRTSGSYGRSRPPRDLGGTLRVYPCGEGLEVRKLRPAPSPPKLSVSTACE
jgi:hypothetical protein